MHTSKHASCDVVQYWASNSFTSLSLTLHDVIEQCEHKGRPPKKTRFLSSIAQACERGGWPCPEILQQGSFDFQNKQEGSTGHEWLGVTVYGEGRLHKRKTAQIYQNGSDKITLLYNLSFLVLMKSLKKEKYDFEENEWLALDIKYE